MNSSGSSTSQHTSPSLLARVRESDASAWRQLVDLYGPLIAGWCRQKGVSPEDGADILQNVFVSVSTGLEKFQPEPDRDGSFRAWLWTITRNRITDFRRSRRADSAAGGSSNLRRMNGAIDGTTVDDVEPTTPLHLHQLMHRAMGQVEKSVDPKTWRAFWRTVIDGQQTSLAANELQMSQASIRQARSRILRRLREQLGDC